MPRAGFRSRLLSATALACTTASFAGAARAACVEHPVDPVVRCNGNVPNGFAAPGSDNLLVEVGNGANIGPIPGQSPSAAITFNLNTADKELTIASGSSLYGGAVRSDSNSGTIGVWNLNPNLFAGVALGAAGDTGTNQVVNQAGGSLGPSSLTGDGGNSFDNAGSTSGAMALERRRHQRRHQPGRREHQRRCSTSSATARTASTTRETSAAASGSPAAAATRSPTAWGPRSGRPSPSPATAGTSSSTGER